MENPTQTVNDMSYFSCLDSVMENSKVRQEQSKGRAEQGWGRMGRFRKVYEGKCGKGKEASSLTSHVVELGDL